MLILTGADVEQALGVEAAIESQRRAFVALGEGVAVSAPKLHLDGEGGSLALAMAGRVDKASGAVCKFASVVPDNPARGLPTVTALVTVLDPETGQAVAVMDGTAVTTLRTAAGSAVAAAALRAEHATTLAVLGAGVQAEAHIRAVGAALPLVEARIYSRDPIRRESLAARLDAELPHAVVSAESAEAAVRGAGLVVCATTSSSPVLDPAWLAEGATVISVGSFAPDRHEISADLLASSDAVVVDDVRTTLELAGPLIAAVREGTVRAEDVISLGAVLVGREVARGSGAERIVYLSVGVGVQDAAAALAVVEAARGLGLGQEVAL